MELGYERRFAEWAARAGCAWKSLRHHSDRCGGETRALQLAPRGETRGIVLMVHGAGNDALFGFVGTFKELLRRGFAIHSFDLAGHGRESTTHFSPDSAMASVEEALARAGEWLPGVPLHAAGVSLGGSILLGSLPSLTPAPISAALFSAPLRIRMSGAALLREAGPGLLRTVWREREHFGLNGLIPSFGPYKREIYPLRLATPPGPGAFGYVKSLNEALDTLDLEQAARRSRVPVLLVYGGRDLLVPVEQAHHLADLLPEAELLVLARESHLTAPLARAGIARWMEWLERLTPARTGETAVSEGR